MKQNDRAMRLSRIFVGLSLLISHIGCVVCACEYAEAMAWYYWATHIGGGMVPHSIRSNYWVHAIYELCPMILIFATAVAMCLVIAKRFSKKCGRCNHDRLTNTGRKSNRLVITLMCAISHLVCCVVPYVIRYNAVVAESIDWPC